MEVSNKFDRFAKLLVQRGMGLYGRTKMESICYESGIFLLDDDSISIPDEKKKSTVDNLMVNYAKFNLVAKMTVMALAKQYEIELPEEIKKKRSRKSRFSRIFRR